MRLRAIAQIHYGQPGKFGTVEPGEDFEPRTIGLADAETARLLAAGHAAPFTARPAAPAAAPPPTPTVAIPADWEKLKGKDAIDLARLLGAPETVTADEAAILIRGAVADRLAGK